MESSTEMYDLLRSGRIQEFNQRKAKGEPCDLRHADLRGVDFSETRLDGASINGARISGAYFPAELPAEEINLSLQHGIRMRYRC